MSLPNYASQVGGQPTTTSQLTGLFKEVYGDEVVSLLPDIAIVTKMVPFVPSEKQLGNKYHQPVVVRNEHGFTYAAPDQGAFALRKALSAVLQDAQIQGTQLVLRSVVSYDAAARAATSKNAFLKETELQVENMLDSTGKRVEIGLFYGQVGLGQVSSTTNVSATSTTLQVSDASWGVGIWSGSEGAPIDLFDSTTKVNTNGDLTISYVDVANKQLTITGVAADITAVDAAAGSPPVLDIYWAGARETGGAFHEFAGFNKIFTNTGSLFNINAATYNLWRGNTYAAGGAIDFSVLNGAIAVATGRGLSENVDVFLSPTKWGELNDDVAGRRRHDYKYDSSESKEGVESITYYSQNGKLSVHSHPVIKESECYVIPMSRARRIGAQDVSFQTPGGNGQGEIFRHLEDHAGYEMRLYTDQALFFETPAKATVITGIV